MYRVWKGILGILALTKIQGGIQENVKYIDRKWGLSVPGKQDSPKCGHGMQVFFSCLSGIWEVVHSIGKWEVKQASIMKADN